MPYRRHLTFFAVPLLALALAACSAGGGADAPAAGAASADAIGTGWTLKADASRLSFVSVKASEVAEVHHFGTLSGRVEPDGTATLEIPLDTVNTGVEIRDQRMKELLFQTGQYPTARLVARIDLAPLATLATGGQMRLPLSGELSLHGVSVPVSTQVAVTRVADDRVLVASLDPLVVNAASFGLVKGLAELQALAKLPSITPDVPVTFQLTFARDA